MTLQKVFVKEGGREGRTDGEREGGTKGGKEGRRDRGKEGRIRGNYVSTIVPSPLPSFLPPGFPPSFPPLPQAVFPLMDRGIPSIPPPGSSAFPILDDRAKRLKLAPATAAAAGVIGAVGRLAHTPEQEAAEHHKAVQVCVVVGAGVAVNVGVDVRVRAHIDAGEVKASSSPFLCAAGPPDLFIQLSLPPSLPPSLPFS